MRIELPRIMTIEGAAHAGFAPGQVRALVRRGLWSRIAPSVLLTRPEPPTRTDWLMVGLIFGGPTSAISGIDAVRLAGVQSGREHLPGLVLTTHGRSKHLDTVLIRRTDRSYRALRTSVLDDHLPFVRYAEVPRAVADASLWASKTSVRAWVTEAVQKRLCTVGDLAVELTAGPRNGSAGLRAAIEDVRDGAASIAEAVAVDHLKRAAVPAFELNVPVVRRGRVIAVVDVLWRELRAVIEIDSRKHHFSDADWRDTLRRHNKLTALGLAVRHDPPVCLDRRWAAEVADWLRRRAGELGMSFVGDARVIRGGPDGPPPLVLE